jgi:hypothetical protein
MLESKSLPDVSEVMGYIGVPISLVTRGTGGVLGVTLCKKWGIEIDPKLICIFGGLATGFFLGGPVTMFALAFIFV